ncbi:MAG: phenylalanine--tRNA ligase subunit beta [Candidatus Hydrogenedentota bacterium]
MKLSLNWLKDYIDLDVSVAELCERMTMLGLEIENVEHIGAEISGVVIGKILEINPHPDADKLVVCRTDVGQAEPLQIVCGAKNMKPGDLVPTATPGGTLPGGITLGKRKMRGVESQGMMCSARELGMGEDHDGLLILDPSFQIGSDAKAALGLDDVVLDIEVIPNRGDWASVIGISRELSAAYGIPMRMPETQAAESGAPAASVSSVTIEDSDICPRYVGRIVRGVKIGPSPTWLVRRLASAGQRSINNVVDITNYVLMETGQPLHAFDFDRLTDQRIVVRRARGGETIKTIDQETRTLTSEMLVIADAKSPVAVAGVMGGCDSEVGAGTTNIFLESAYFEPTQIRRTARGLNLKTEASQRFQRGADPEMALFAANRAARLLAEIAGGQAAPGALDEYPRKQTTPEIALRFARSDALIGCPVDAATQQRYLTALGFKEARADAASVTVTPPSWRYDCSIEADLIEEVVRLHGYEKVPATLPSVRRTEVVLAPDLSKLFELRHFMAGLGLSEFIHWTFTCLADVERAGLGERYGQMLGLMNPLTENHSTMRRTLIPQLIQAASSNLRKNVPYVAAFEIGPVFMPQEELPEETQRLGIVLAGTRPKHWAGAERAVDFYDLKGLLEAVLAHLGVEAEYSESDLPCFAPGEGASLVSGKKAIGDLGRIHPKVAEAFETTTDVYAAEIDLSAVIGVRVPVPQFKEIPAFPHSLRDLAVVVDQKIQVGALLAEVRQAGGKLLHEARVFDVYTGKPVPEGKKSVAIGLVFQSGEGTLTDKDTDKAVQKIRQGLVQEFEAEQR